MKRHRTYSSWEDIHQDQSFHPMLHYKHVDTYPLPGDMLETDLPIALTLENHFANHNAEYKDLCEFTPFPLPRVEGVHIAGGSLVRFLLQHSCNPNEYDLDCFIVGPTQEIRDQRCREFLTLLSNPNEASSNENVTMFKTYPSIIEVHKPNYPVIQVVMTMMQHMVEVVSDFDFSINRVWVDSSGKIRALPSAELSHQFLVNHVAFPSYKPERMEKYSTFHPELRTINPFPTRVPKKQATTKAKEEPFPIRFFSFFKPIPIIPGSIYRSTCYTKSKDILIRDWHTCFIAPGMISIEEKCQDPKKFDYYIISETTIKVYGHYFQYYNREVLTTTHFSCRFMADQSRCEILWIQLVPNPDARQDLYLTHTQTRLSFVFK